MMKFFKRRRPVPAVDIDDPLAIRDLLDHPTLRALVVDTERDDAGAPEVTPSLLWAGLVAAGPIRFDPTTHPDLAA